MMNKKLMRTQHDRMIAGVCGGLGHYLGLEPVLIRLAFVLFTLAGGAGMLVYLILWIVVPQEGARAAAGPVQITGDQQQRTALLVGGGLILIGAWTLLGNIPGLAWLSLHNLWPLLLIAIGVMMIVNYSKQREGN